MRGPVSAIAREVSRIFTKSGLRMSSTARMANLGASDLARWHRTLRPWGVRHRSCYASDAKSSLHRAVDRVTACRSRSVGSPSPVRSFPQRGTRPTLLRVCFKSRARRACFPGSAACPEPKGPGNTRHLAGQGDAGVQARSIGVEEAGVARGNWTRRHGGGARGRRVTGAALGAGALTRTGPR